MRGVFKFFFFSPDPYLIKDICRVWKNWRQIISDLCFSWLIWENREEVLFIVTTQQADEKTQYWSQITHTATQCGSLRLLDIARLQIEASIEESIGINVDMGRHDSSVVFQP